MKKALPSNISAMVSTMFLAILAEVSAVNCAHSSQTFPNGISRDGRYFEDGKSKPFLIHGDTAWSLIVQLDLKEGELYLDTRKAQGFNSILVNLIERKFSKTPPKNAEGEEPFAKSGDFSTPSEKYFAHVDAVLEMAARG